MKNKITPFLILALFSSLSLSASSSCCSKWSDLFDAELSQFEKWMGIPHSTVTGLPKGTYQSDNVHKGTPMGLNSDLKSVFTTFEENGETILHISGEIYGGLTTLDSYKNYHLQVQMKWGEKRWEPRLDTKRDSGILYHCHGEHGSFWNVWKSCLECQVQEKDIGDFIPLAGPNAMFRGRKDGDRMVFDPEVDEYVETNGYMHCLLEPDYPNGEWNTIDIYVLENSAIHVVNGVVVMAIKDAIDKEGNPLTEGQIQLQSEAAECFYKNLRIRPIKAFPEDLKKAAHL